MRSAIFAQRDRLTDAGIIDRNSAHLMHSMQPNIITEITDVESKDAKTVEFSPALCKYVMVSKGKYNIYTCTTLAVY